MPYQAQHLPQAPTREAIDALPGTSLLEFGAPWCPHCQSAQPLIAAAQSRTPQQGNAPATHVVTLACGHQHMLDATPAMVQALADFVRS